ncbi:uncharacterized protein CCR75_002975 [Bremia lactucae]|uniref:Uncharacterized protein n=1 Tax=Bremia lactucae TaxID=4779 RepID=A0A976NZQ5_BRELC|nr:hypothetical protein CCR75_002975 [Bremia lactucae]
MTNTADKGLVEGIEALEKYLEQHEVANLKLKQGLLMLTKAKLRLPEHTLTEISYRENFHASRVVTLDSEGTWRLQDTPKLDYNGVDNSTLRNRKASNNINVSASTPSTCMESLLWFSSLPPTDLRQTQKQFLDGESSLELNFAY